MPAYLPDPATEIFEWLVPELQRRGLFHPDYEGDGTSRGGLGLQRPGFRSRGRLTAYNKKIETMGKQA
jgi:N-acetyl-S-(2-succino)cysteine monooxygenase